MNANKKPRCSYISKIGSRCQADPEPGKSYCFFHDPEQKKKQAAARQQNEEARSPETEIALPPDPPVMPPQNVSYVTALMVETIDQLRGGEIDLPTAKAIGHLATILLRAQKEDTLYEHLASGVATGPGKNPHLDVNITEIFPDFNFDSKKNARQEAKQDQTLRNTVSPDIAASAPAFANAPELTNTH